MSSQEWDSKPQGQKGDRNETLGQGVLIIKNAVDSQIKNLNIHQNSPSSLIEEEDELLNHKISASF
jgi:hypothetical protein